MLTSIILDRFNLPDNVDITINNLKGAESGLLRGDGKVVDISLANCYTLEKAVNRCNVNPEYFFSPPPKAGFLRSYPANFCIFASSVGKTEDQYPKVFD